MADLARSSGVVPRSATSLVEALVVAGLVSRHCDPRDRRSSLVCSTTAGHACAERITAARRQAADQIFGALGRVERSQLARILASLSLEAGEHERFR
jgi:DNA-binding MarR family transcriptional regulator